MMIGKSLFEFVKKIKNSRYNYYIIAYCPKQEHSEIAKKILDVLKEIGNLYFFVQKNSFADNREISEDEISGLEKYGIVEIFEGKYDFKERSYNFKEFISRKL
ncbi:hypothetical protein [Empedobacter brevis]|uniref:hypothetical protein n=1 Tax=Empedobacter brevis TaxID=247 RepID=UPI00334234CC